MALSKQPRSAEEIEARRLEQEQKAREKKQEEQDAVLLAKNLSAAAVANTRKSDIPADAPAPQTTATFVPPQFVPPTVDPNKNFQPNNQREKRVLAVGEGIRATNYDLHTKKSQISAPTVKRTRITTGKLTAEDVLTKDYNQYYAPNRLKVVEITQWVQKTLSDNDKNEEISKARRERGEKYEEMAAFIDNLLVKYFSESNVVSPKDQGYVIQAAINEILGLGPLEPLWQDNRISEIMVNGPYKVRVEIQGVIRDAPGCQFRDAEHLLQVCQQILGDIGRRVDISKPTADGSLPDGSRINVVHQEVAPKGPFLTIRRFPDTVFTIKELINKKSMTEEMALEIGNLIHKGCSALISGGTGSGKTSMLNALSGAIPLDDRVITIEDTLELRLNPKKDILAMRTKDSAANGEGGVSIRDLMKNALRMRPDRIVVGECRGSEAYDMLQAMNTGHDGSMTTVHANDADGTIVRLTNLIGEMGDFPPERALPLIAGGLDIIVSIARYEDGSRRVATVSEVPSRITMEAGITKLTPIILWEFRQDAIVEGKIVGHYEKINDLSEEIIRKHRLDKKDSLTIEELIEISRVDA